jgi:hypothetical protein
MMREALFFRLSIEGYVWWKQEAARARAEGFPRAASRIEDVAAALFADATRYDGAALANRTVHTYLAKVLETQEAEGGGPADWFPPERAA